MTISTRSSLPGASPVTRMVCGWRSNSTANASMIARMAFISDRSTWTSTVSGGMSTARSRRRSPAMSAMAMVSVELSSRACSAFGTSVPSASTTAATLAVAWASRSHVSRKLAIDGT